MIHWDLILLYLAVTVNYIPVIGFLSVILVPIIFMDYLSKKSGYDMSRKLSDKEEYYLNYLSSEVNLDNVIIRVSDSINGGLYFPGVFKKDLIIIDTEIFDDKEVLDFVIAHEIGHSRRKSKYLGLVPIFLPFVVLFLVYYILNVDIFVEITISFLLLPFISICNAYISRKVELLAMRQCWKMGVSPTEGIMSSIDEDRTIWEKLFSRQPSNSDIVYSYIKYEDES